MSDYTPIPRLEAVFRTVNATTASRASQGASAACEFSNAPTPPSSIPPQSTPANRQTASQLAFERGFCNGWYAAIRSSGLIRDVGMFAEFRDETDADYWDNFKVGGTD